MQGRGRGERDIAAEAGADQHEVALHDLAGINQPGDARLGRIDAPIVDRQHFIALAAGGLGERNDLATVRGRVLPV